MESDVLLKKWNQRPWHTDHVLQQLYTYLRIGTRWRIVWFEP